MEEIRINEYVRTKNGIIGKVTDLIKTKELYYFDKCGFDYKKNIVNHSFNIIDLIEVGDIVEISDVLHNDIFYIWSEDMIKAVKEDIENGIQLKSIVTKEQFESIKYEV